MKVARLYADENAVSPVIGVILMVAVTVIMAAITGAFVLSMQTDVGVAPQASWDVSAEDTNANSGLDQVLIRHRAGDAVDTSNLRVQVPGQSSGVGGANFVDVGDVIDVELEDTTTGPAGNELLLVWSEDGGNSVVLKRHTFTTEYGNVGVNASVR